jgi:hypothetical protein
VRIHRGSSLGYQGTVAQVPKAAHVGLTLVASCRCFGADSSATAEAFRTKGQNETSFGAATQVRVTRLRPNLPAHTDLRAFFGNGEGEAFYWCWRPLDPWSSAASHANGSGSCSPWTTGSGACQITVDAGTRGSAWNRFYEKVVASDHANTVLTTAWGRNVQAASKKGHDQAGFQYVRFHGILDSDIGVYTESGGTPVYTWTRLDQVYDAIIAADMRPFVEISFMPPPLASGTTTLHWYNRAAANTTPPKDWTKWTNFMTALVQHLEEPCRFRENGQWVAREPFWRLV